MMKRTLTAAVAAALAGQLPVGAALQILAGEEAPAPPHNGAVHRRSGWHQGRAVTAYRNICPTDRHFGRKESDGNVAVRQS